MLCPASSREEQLFLTEKLRQVCFDDHSVVKTV
jgi:hypothetical protein